VVGTEFVVCLISGALLVLWLAGFWSQLHYLSNPLTLPSERELRYLSLTDPLPLADSVLPGEDQPFMD
jgi:hypothetical protein